MYSTRLEFQSFLKIVCTSVVSVCWPVYISERLVLAIFFFEELGLTVLLPAAIGSSSLTMVLRKELMEVLERIPYSPKFPEAKLEVRSMIAKPRPSMSSWSLVDLKGGLLVMFDH